MDEILEQMELAEDTQEAIEDAEESAESAPGPKDAEELAESAPGPKDAEELAESAPGPEDAEELAESTSDPEDAEELAESTSDPESTIQGDDIKPSEVFQGFLDYLKLCQDEYQENVQEVWKYDRSLQDDLHAFEFAESDDEAAALGIEFRHKRRERRKRKDAAKLYEEGAKFYCDKGNKQFLNKVRELLRNQERNEDYLKGERIYKPRGGGSDGGN